MENAEIIYDLCPGKFIWILKSLIISGKQYFWTTIQKGVPFNSKHILLENACPKLILAGTTISRKKNGGPDLICENNFKGKTISEMKKWFHPNAHDKKLIIGWQPFREKKTEGEIG